MIIVYAALGNTIHSSAWTAARSNSEPPPSHSSHFFASHRETLPPRRQPQRPQQAAPTAPGMQQIPREHVFPQAKGRHPTDHTIEIGRPDLRGLAYAEEDWDANDHIPRPPQIHVITREDAGQDEAPATGGTLVGEQPSRRGSFDHNRYPQDALSHDLELGSTR